jgi:hypothetical protein
MNEDETGADQETECTSFSSGPEAGAGAGTAKNARRALRILLSPTKRSQTANKEQGFDPRCTFEHMALCTDDFIATVAQGDGGGLEHRLYVAATDRLSDEEYLARIDVSSAATEATEPI